MSDGNREAGSEGNDHYGSKPKRRKISRVSTSVEEPQEVKSPSTKVSTQSCGLIERIILKNVMCHEHLDFDGFTPNVNLLQGANGSGKSTIVAAIIAGLGGSSKATDRAKNLQSLIQNGKNSASIEIHLKNNGCSPYKFDVYGEKIIVERRITLSGSSSYKIKSAKGQPVSTKKEDLSRILDWYNLQVDNPVIILSQERAKSFLNNTSPSSLFEFYMTATQLRQYIDTHGETQNNYHTSKELVKHKLESLPILDAEVKELSKKVEAINSLEEKKKGFSRLRQEISWAEVIEKEQEANKSEEEMKKNEKNLNLLDAKLNDLKKEKEKLSNMSSESDATLLEMDGKGKNVEEELLTTNQAHTKAKLSFRELMNEKNQLEKDIIEKESDIRILKDKLESDAKDFKGGNDWKTTNAKLKAEKEELMRESANLEQSFENECDHMKTLTEQLQESENECHRHQQEQAAITKRLGQLNTELRSLKETTNKLTVFGRYMPRVIQEIEAADSRGHFDHKPIGPVGNHMKVGKPEWIHIVEEVTQGLLTSFLVSGSRDYNCLIQIFRQTIPENENEPSIIQMPFRQQIHDVRRFEVIHPSFQSMWSLIETDNVQVSNALLDQLQVESLLLVNTAEEANDLLIEQNRVPKNCKKAITLNGDHYFPDPNFKVYSGRSKKQTRYLQVSVQKKISDLNKNILHTKAEVEQCIRETPEKKSAIEVVRKHRNDSLRKQKDCKERLKKCKGQLQELKNREIAPPSDVCQLQNDLTQIENEKNNVEMEREKFKKRIEEAREREKEALIHLKKARENTEKLRVSVNLYKETTKKNDAELRHKKKETLVLESKKKECQRLLSLLSEDLSKKESEIEHLTKKAMELCPQRIQPKNSKKNLERELTAQKNAIDRELDLHGNVTDITTNLREKMVKYEKIKKEVNSQDCFLKKLQNSLKDRSTFMDVTKKLHSSSTKTAFLKYIGIRNMVGQMDVDYKGQTLKIVIRKNTGNKILKFQSIEMLSGGERSFVTVSFILALWDHIQSPVRIMDEFDIFMDVVSRKQCVEMIVNAVKPSIQYIMVSPLEYRVQSKQLHIFRMPTPERGNNEEDASEEI